MGGVHLGIGSNTGRVPSTAPARIPSHTGGPVQSTHCDRVDDCWDPWREPIAAAMAGYNTTTVRRLVGGHRWAGRPGWRALVRRAYRGGINPLRGV